MKRFTSRGIVDAREDRKGFSDPDDGGMGFLGGMAGGISSGNGEKPLDRNPVPCPTGSPMPGPKQSLNFESLLSRMYGDSLLKPPCGGGTLAGMDGGDCDPPGWFREGSDPDRPLRRLSPVRKCPGRLGVGLGRGIVGFGVLERPGV